jgi:hypothetical protein
MKKEIIITFDIYQDTLNNQKPDFTVYCEDLPDNLESFTQKELEASGINKMMKPPGERKEIDGKFARRYIYRIPEEKIKELLSHTKTN